MKQLLVLLTIALFTISCGQNSGNDMAAGTGSADTAQAPKPETKEERNKKVIAEAIAALNAHDIDKIKSSMAAETVDYGDGSRPPIKGADSVAANIAGMFASFPDFKADNIKYYADGDEVVVIAEFTGTFKNDMGKMKATGKSFKFMDADIFSLNDEGKVTSHKYIQSDNTMMSQILGKK